MKASIILSLVSLCAAVAIDTEVIDVISPLVDAAAPGPDAIAGGFGATCWDYAMDQTYFYATCSSGGAGSPAVRSAVDLSKKLPQKKRILFLLSCN
jgi:hypothetical protein